MDHISLHTHSPLSLQVPAPSHLSLPHLISLHAYPHTHVPLISHCYMASLSDCPRFSLLLSRSLCIWDTLSSCLFILSMAHSPPLCTKGTRRRANLPPPPFCRAPLRADGRNGTAEHAFDFLPWPLDSLSHSLSLSQHFLDFSPLTHLSFLSVHALHTRFLSAPHTLSLSFYTHLITHATPLWATTHLLCHCTHLSHRHVRPLELHVAGLSVWFHALMSHRVRFLSLVFSLSLYTGCRGVSLHVSLSALSLFSLINSLLGGIASLSHRMHASPLTASLWILIAHCTFL